MLPRKRRLKQQDLPTQKGGVLHSPFFAVRYWECDPVERSVFRVVVSKKIHKQAVGRHRVKRRVHEAIHTLLPDVVNGFVVVINTKQPILTASFEDIQQEITKLFLKIGLIVK